MKKMAIGLSLCVGAAVMMSEAEVQAYTPTKAHITGTVWKIEKKVGDTVAEGDVVVILESMKMEMPIEAPSAGTIQSISVSEGQAVTEGDPVMFIGFNSPITSDAHEMIASTSLPLSSDEWQVPSYLASNFEHRNKIIEHFRGPLGKIVGSEEPSGASPEGAPSSLSPPYIKRIDQIVDLISKFTHDSQITLNSNLTTDLKISPDDLVQLFSSLNSEELRLNIFSQDQPEFGTVRTIVAYLVAERVTEKFRRDLPRFPSPLNMNISMLQDLGLRSEDPNNQIRVFFNALDRALGITFHPDERKAFGTLRTVVDYTVLVDVLAKQAPPELDKKRQIGLSTSILGLPIDQQGIDNFFNDIEKNFNTSIPAKDRKRLLGVTELLVDIVVVNLTAKMSTAHRESLNLSSSFVDLSIDPSQLKILLIEVGKSFGLTIPDTLTFTTIGDVVLYVAPNI